jgi:hypothetical protein
MRIAASVLKTLLSSPLVVICTGNIVVAGASAFVPNMESSKPMSNFFSTKEQKKKRALS